MTRTVLLLLLAATIALPFILRPKRPAMAQAGDALVIITPHNEAIRHEFGLAFQRWYREQTGRTVFVDWRVIGGTSEITRYLDGAYTASFQDYWTHTLRREWSNAVEAGFDDARVQPAAKPGAGHAGPGGAARVSGIGRGLRHRPVLRRRPAMISSNRRGAGHIVDCGVLQRHPEWFTDEAIPRFFAGEEYWDPRGRWVGTVLSNYGILYNKESLARLGVASAPRAWADLKDPRLLGEVALADPTRSSSMAKAFENVIQQHMQERLLALMVAADRISSLDEKAVEAQAVHEGWIEGLQFLQLIGANARYFTDSPQKVPIDVADGNCAAGMCIDFYGRQQAEAERRRGGADRLVFVVAGRRHGCLGRSGRPPARRKEPARWRWRSSTGWFRWTRRSSGLSSRARRAGPQRYNLRRMPVRRDFYAREDWKPFRSDPEVSPFEDKNQLIYHAAWTDGLFRELAFIIRVMCQDTHPELARAWRAIIAAGKPPQAMAVLQDMSAVDYDKAAGEDQEGARLEEQGR